MLDTRWKLWWPFLRTAQAIRMQVLELSEASSRSGRALRDAHQMVALANTVQEAVHAFPYTTPAQAFTDLLDAVEVVYKEWWDFQQEHLGGGAYPSVPS